MKAPDPLEELLAAWDLDVQPERESARKVLHRVALAADEGERVGRRLHGAGLLLKPLVLAAGLTLVFWTVLAFSPQISRQEVRWQQELYRNLVHPGEQLQTALLADGPAEVERASLVELLDWMRVEFSLSREQFSRLATVHRDYDDRFESLAADIAELRRRYSRFEEQRLNHGDVDFMALYDLLQERDLVRDQADRLSRDLVRKVLVILTPAQRTEYLSVLSSMASGLKADGSRSDA